jgi:hypothetical protein
VIRHGPRALQLAVIYAGMGEKDTAFARLNHAYEDCSYILALHFTTDARLDTLHSEPHFPEHMRKIGCRNSDRVAEPVPTILSFALVM